MGENEGVFEPGGTFPNGLMPGAGPVMQALDTDRWMKAEEKIAQLIACIQPNPMSEERRNAVADYVQRLIMKCFPCQVCTFGSVPLKTYLPDGDIDLTAFSHNQSLKDTWANQVRDMLENEEKNENAEFHVKEVQYIQAEVKIIKCLVENIVVDISFNQVGGLCTLCFLDEVDNLINQNHLFKRSIILIKAWCYYESRILGAHHGLISTYALETLVLYIFHVFNNSFHGPLEVLYRFLEFFSNFDWDNFCVSLWGPVPISSLPDVTAEPPRKDSGELLLSKLFLEACSTVYAVFPGGQENNGQPFVSKHFNVIDPLRVNNNLGRSVSKGGVGIQSSLPELRLGSYEELECVFYRYEVCLNENGNFFRIRSAFAFGAKRLARLLDCPVEKLIFEINQFFFNTWERHGSGHRPDVPPIDSYRLRLSTTDAPNDFDSPNNKSRKKINENSSAQGVDGEGIWGHGISRKNSARMMPVTSELFAHPHGHSLKPQINSNSMQTTDQVGRETSSDQVLPNEQIQRGLKADHLVNDIQGRVLFARTHSSPELTDTYADVSSQARHNKTETANTHVANARVDITNRRKNLGSESMASHSSRSSGEDTPSVKHAPSHHSVDGAADSNRGSNSHHPDLGFDGSGEDFSSYSELQMMRQEEQDIVNMMASASLQGFNGQVHVPFNLTTGHLPFPIPPSFLASMGYNQRNLPGFVPANIPLIDQSFSNMQFPQGLVSPQLTHYFPGIGLNSPSEDSAERSNENLGPEQVNSSEIDSDFWPERDVGSSGVYDPEHVNVDMHQPDDKPPAPLSRLKYIPPPLFSGSGSVPRVQSKHSSKEKRGAMRGNIGSFAGKDNRSSDGFLEERSVSSRFSSGNHSNSFRSRTSSEGSWDGSSVKTPNSTREKRGKKVFSSDETTVHGKGKIMSEQASLSQDEDQDWGSMSNIGTEMIEGNSVAEPIASLPVPRHHVPEFEAAQTSGSDSMIPFAPMLIGPGSRQRMNDNSGLIAFYPTGPPIPFLTMLPLYNIPPETETSDSSSVHFGGDETLDNIESGQNFSPERFDQSEDLKSSSSLIEASTVETSEEPKSDILNSDFASHWQNLQFGRLCQNPPYHGPLTYPPPVMVPPVYLQSRFAYENPGRPLTTNSNLFSQIMTGYGQHLVPIAAPLQSVSSRTPNLYQHYMDDMPRYRGTGTYLPNPQKVPMRERQTPGSRRGNYNHDRKENYGDREGNWNANPKSRAAARNHSRSQTEKSNSRTDRLVPSESRADRSWNSYRHDSIPPYQSQNGPLHSASNHNGPQNVAYNMYPLATPNPNGVSNGPVPPVMMLYPFDHSATYGSLGEQLEFGSLGPVGFPGISEQSQLNEGARARAFEDHRLRGSSGHRSSPDQPSSPHHHRRVS